MAGTARSFKDASNTTQSRSVKVSGAGLDMTRTNIVNESDSLVDFDTYLTALNNYLAIIAGYVDTLETLVAATNTKSDVLHADNGAKTTAVPALGTGGSGIIGWLSEIRNSVGVGLLYTDYSVSSATGSSQSILAANTAARQRIIINDGATTWTLHPTGGTAAVGGTGCMTLRPGDSWTTNLRNAVTGISTAGAKLTVLEA